MSVVESFITFKLSLKNEMQKKYLNQLWLYKWIVIQVVIHLLTTSAKKHGIVNFVIRT